jgi:DNA polymerase elongation subunit (family B)
MTYKKHEKALFKSLPKRNERKRFGVLDLETDGLGGAFIEGAMEVEGEYDIFFSQDLAQIIANLFSKKYRDVIWYGHNLSEYDLKYLIQYINDNRQDIKIQCSVRGSRITWTKLTKNKHTVELRDSLHLIQDTLRNIGKKFGAAEEKGFIDFSKVCYNPNNAEHRDYLRRDVEVLLDVLIRLDASIFDKFGIHLKATMASTSLACFKSTLSEDEMYWRLPEKIEKYIRENTYFGGMVFAKERRFIPDCVHIDVNAMYAASMLQYGVPCGTAIYTHKEVDGYRGFYKCRVTAPQKIPFTFVAYRTEQGGCAYPTGCYETYIDSDTIDFARECGYIIDVIDGYVFERVDHIFDNFLNYCQDIEIGEGCDRNTGKRNPIGEAIKLVRNSCYGIFGLKPLGKKLVASQDDLGPPYDLIFDDVTNEMLYGWYEEKNKIEAGYIQPHWAAWITAHARLLLAKMVYATGAKEVWYGDTDSLVMNRFAYEKALKNEVFTVGNRYGMVKVEATYK